MILFLINMSLKQAFNCAFKGLLLSYNYGLETQFEVQR